MGVLLTATAEWRHECSHQAHVDARLESCRESLGATIVVDTQVPQLDAEAITHRASAEQSATARLHRPGFQAALKAGTGDPEDSATAELEPPWVRGYVEDADERFS